MNPNENPNLGPQVPQNPNQPEQNVQNQGGQPAQQPPQQNLDPQRVAYAENYFRQNMSYYPIESLKNALIAGGYNDAEVNQAVNNLNNPQVLNNQNQNMVGDPLDISYLFKSTWYFFKKEVFVLGIIPLISYFPMFLFGFIFGFQHPEMIKRTKYINKFSSNVTFELKMELNKEIGAVLLSSPVYILLLILGIVVSIIGTVALYKAVVDFERGIKVTVFSAYKNALPLVLPFLLVNLLVVLAVLGGFLLLIVPGIIFALWFMYSQFALVSDNYKGTEALKRSKEIIQGKVGAVFLRVFLAGIIVGVVRIPFSILALVPFFGYFVNMAFNIVSTVFTVIFSFHLFKGVKQLKGLE